jgi:hypothetical protein
MIRTQAQFTEEQYAQLKELARATNEPIAALIRRGVDQLLLTRKPDRKAMYRQAQSVVGKYRSKKSDIAAEHDRHLDEAFT